MWQMDGCIGSGSPKYTRFCNSNPYLVVSADIDIVIHCLACYMVQLFYSVLFLQFIKLKIIF